MDNKISLPFITKFERARIISIRAQEIADGSLSTVRLKGTPYQIACEEFRQAKIPHKIIRKFPNGKTEEWNLKDFSNL